MPEIKFKVKQSIPLPMEVALCQKYGFHVSFRNKTDKYVVFAKEVSPINRRKQSSDELDENVKNVLIKKMNKIVDFYDDPEASMRSIRARLNNLAMCHEGVARQFVYDWMGEYAKDNLVEV